MTALRWNFEVEHCIEPSRTSCILYGSLESLILSLQQVEPNIFESELTLVIPGRILHRASKNSRFPLFHQVSVAYVPDRMQAGGHCVQYLGDARIGLG